MSAVLEETRLSPRVPSISSCEARREHAKGLFRIARGRLKAGCSQDWLPHEQAKGLLTQNSSRPAEVLIVVVQDLTTSSFKPL
jgi:hypothetical protein